MVLIAMVEPCRNSPADRKSLPVFSIPLPMPSTRRCGVDSVLPKVSAPVCSSNTAISVKVPPISAARRMWGRDFADFMRLARALHVVMAGLVPAIHVFFAQSKQDVDARDKRGHDGVAVAV